MKSLVMAVLMMSAVAAYALDPEEVTWEHGQPPDFEIVEPLTVDEASCVSWDPVAVTLSIPSQETARIEDLSCEELREILRNAGIETITYPVEVQP